METESSNNNHSSRNKLTTGDFKSRSRSKEKAMSNKSSPAVRPQKSTFTPPENWVDAPEFVPRWLASNSGMYMALCFNRYLVVKLVVKASSKTRVHVTVTI